MYVIEGNNDIQQNNVYTVVKAFYDKHHFFDEGYIMPRSLVERYFRKKAWGRVTDEELQDRWAVLELVLLYIEDKEIYDLERLLIYDYQLMLWMAAHNELGKNKYLLTDDNIKYFLEVLRDFYEEYANDPLADMERIDSILSDFESSVYVKGKFDFPEINEDDEFFELLLHIEDATMEETQIMNEMLEKILNNISHYFHRFSEDDMDFSKAMFLYTALQRNLDGAEDKDFWFGFWDYFMFDYHLNDTDMVPIYYYYLKRKNSLPASHKMILRDLINAKFHVFEIKSIEDGSARCLDILLDEYFEIPAPPNVEADYANLIVFGHTHKSGAMLVNYLTQYPASQKIRERIRAEIDYQLEMYRCQKPQATMQEFIERHNAVIRHIIYVFVTRSQLGITSVRQLPEPRKQKKRYRLSKRSREEFSMILMAMGIGKYGTKLAIDLHTDAVNSGAIGSWEADSDLVLCAICVLFCRINTHDIIEEKSIYRCFDVKKRDVQQLLVWITDILNLTEYDPRYLTEEGFVRALYNEL